MKNLFTSACAALLVFVSQSAFAQFTVNGNATDISTTLKPNSFELTPDASNQTSAVWSNTRIDILNNSFALTFKANFGSKDLNGAEGIGLVFQKSAAGTAWLGGSSQTMGFQGITPSLNVEFDTYDDGAHVGDIPADHIAVSQNGSTANPLTTAVQASATNENIEDGYDHNVEVDWDANAKTLYIFFNGTLRQAYTGDVVKDIFGSDGNVFWGFTAGTRGHSNQQRVYSVNMALTPASNKSFSPLPVTLVNFSASKADKGIILAWTTATEKNSAFFQIERSTDGKNWNVLNKIAAHGTSNSLNTYGFNDLAAAGQVYYRLKMVDLDGSFEYSKIVAVKLTSQLESSLTIYPNPVKNADELSIKFNASENETASVTLLNAMGTIVRSETKKCLSGENVLQLNMNSVKPGMYILQVVNGVSKETTKIVVR